MASYLWSCSLSAILATLKAAVSSKDVRTETRVLNVHSSLET